MKAGDAWGHPTHGSRHRPHLLMSIRAEWASGVLQPSGSPQPGLDSELPLAPLLGWQPPPTALWVNSLSSCLCSHCTLFLLPAVPFLLLGSSCPRGTSSRKPFQTMQVHGNSCLPPHTPKIKVGFDWALNHHLQSNRHFTRYFPARVSLNLTGTLWGQMDFIPVLQMGTPEARGGCELTWGRSCTNG